MKLSDWAKTSVWSRNAVSFESVVIVVTVILLTVLAVMVFWARHVGAEELPACTSIKRVLVTPGVIEKVVDGDTFHVFTFDVPNVIKIRIQDAETPERGQEGFQEAQTFTAEWLARGPFHVLTCGQHTFDRIVGVVVRGEEVLADELKSAGYWREKH